MLLVTGLFDALEIALSFIITSILYQNTFQSAYYGKQTDKVQRYMLSQAELEQFNEQGFILVPRLLEESFCSKLLDRAQVELQEATGFVEYEADVHYPGSPSSRQALGGNTIRRLLQVYTRAPIFKQLATDPKITHCLHQLLGKTLFMSQAHHNCIMTKQPFFSSRTAWHRDIRYWNFEKPQLITAWTAIKQESQQNGCLYVLPGTHKLSSTDIEFNKAQFLKEDSPKNRKLLQTAIAIELNPGDTLFFHCQLFHAAGKNLTNDIKMSLVFTYHGENNQPLAGTRSASLPEIIIQSRLHYSND